MGTFDILVDVLKFTTELNDNMYDIFVSFMIFDVPGRFFYADLRYDFKFFHHIRFLRKVKIVY